MNEKIEGVRNKIEEIDEKIVALGKDETEIIKKLESVFERKIVTLENNISTLRKSTLKQE